ncbi:hypothetical protein PGT21_008093 [Puccinia graminis f. sp. tritici]|uniref:Uncharacterized protein n=1 Tax=Puccinia graminis f. sp. tritici TaxID=56615 RepID=A0A5B0NIS7_PUCGR|nr:hypothetical protein PGT21_008093 [Puccinia graminis f. sp. tritici]
MGLAMAMEHRWTELLDHTHTVHELTSQKPRQMRAGHCNSQSLNLEAAHGPLIYLINLSSLKTCAIVDAIAVPTHSPITKTGATHNEHVPSHVSFNKRI